MSKDLKRTSKYLSLLLRHRPEEANLTLDAYGWVAVADLLHNTTITQTELDTIVATDAKGRYAYSEDKARIRATQGHSVPIQLALLPQTPPAKLYHGTVGRFMGSIQQQGLLRGKRHHVHLSATIKTARAVGSRRGSPIVLKIDAAQMDTDGILFYQSENGVWLTDTVAPQYLSALPID